MSRRVIIMTLGALAAFVGASAGVLVSLHERQKPAWQDHWTPKPEITATCEGIPTRKAVCNAPEERTFYYVTGTADKRKPTWLKRDFSFVCKDGSQSKEPCPNRGAGDTRR